MCGGSEPAAHPSQADRLHMESTVRTWSALTACACTMQRSGGIDGAVTAACLMTHRWYVRALQGRCATGSRPRTQAAANSRAS